MPMEKIISPNKGNRGGTNTPKIILGQSSARRNIYLQFVCSSVSSEETSPRKTDWPNRQIMWKPVILENKIKSSFSTHHFILFGRDKI
jgi:hypothetical protein